MKGSIRAQFWLLVLFLHGPFRAHIYVSRGIEMFTLMGGNLPFVFLFPLNLLDDE